MAHLPELHVARALTGRRILFAGVTGFVGKVTLSLLLHRYGRSLDQVYVLVRKGSAASAERRFFDKVASSEPFQPLRDAMGEEGALEFLRQKCVVLQGDISDPRLGLSQEQVEALRGNLDVVVNCAGLVSFNPSLELSLRVNTCGVKNAVDLCLDLDVPLVHVSTAYVAGNRDGLVFEDEEIVGQFPKKGELDGRDFSLQQELEDAERLGARLRQQADDRVLSSLFRKRALERLSLEGRDVNDEKTVRLAVGRERKLWLTTEMVKAGMERAEHWGWPNTYTYTKALGEQVIASAPNLRCGIVRPSIVESAVRYPFPGWNEGFTTSAPLCFASLRGHRLFPAGGNILDVIPVDLVAGATIAVIAQQITTRERRVYQMGSSDSNPFVASRSVELTGLYRRRYYRNKTSGNRFWNELMARIEPQAVSGREFELRSAPLFVKASQTLRGAIREYRPKWGAPRVNALLDRALEKLDEVEDQARSLTSLIELFMPFIWANSYIFRCDNTRSLYERMNPEDRARIPWDPENIDWRNWFLEVHLPGLEKYVFPGLEEETQRRKALHAYRDLLELFEASVNQWRHRVAFRMVEGEREERFTYGEAHRYASRIGSFLLAGGVGRGDRVVLVSENRPEWGITYFGILSAGATVVPVDPQLTTQEIVNIARRAEAKFCLISEQVHKDCPELEQGLRQARLSSRLHSLAEAMAGDPSQPDGIGQVRRTAAPDDVASLIFTSGTTGQPKGVMLTHRNFASLVAKLASVFDIGVGDGLLSVLPLHHTFEFSCGFLTPFSRGAEVTYLDELTADRLGEVFETGRVTAMIGVPAVWQLLHRKITQELAAKPPIVEQAIKTLMSAHGELRNSRNVNLGKLLFWPVHRKFGGRMRFLVSGGSALPDEVHQAFHELGFDLAEGYGLTETAPVLTVAEAGNKRKPGTVGRPLGGIELKIDSPDESGVGEVIARGPNVMAGYFGDREATEAVMVDGWLHTGDLGRLDADGNLYLLGRKKDVIIDASGKNVYPDELEELYGKHEHIKELSIVGLPDDSGGEKVACLCVPDYKDRPRDEVRREIDEHFRRISADMPFHRRVKVLRLWEGELPRTSTRKVRRKLVIEELQRLERVSASAEKARGKVTAHGELAQWLYPLIAEVAQKPVSAVRPESKLQADLGFDSLMVTELSVALEQAGVPPVALEDLTKLETVDELRKLITSTGRHVSAGPRARERAPAAEKGESLELEVPEPVAHLGRALVHFGQKVLYGGVFDVEVIGRAFIPQNQSFLVAANHSSHLDMGLVKIALGDQGERLTALAARDYFFDTRLKRAWFENFTNLVPMDRKGSLRESLRLAGESLNQGYNLLIFPEGTRSTTGEMGEFKPTLGYLALTHGVDILPMYLEGTHEALPKGRIFPKRKNLKVRIGPVVSHAELRRLTQGMARSESYRYVTRVVEEMVRALAEGKVLVTAPVREPERPPEEAQPAIGEPDSEAERGENGNGVSHEQPPADSLQAAPPQGDPELVALACTPINKETLE
jgi:long-chain acyl-CoA synthetase